MGFRVKLTDCRQGDTVIVEKISGSGPLRKRLLEMGFTRGAPVKIIKYAPLRDPIEIEIKHFHISLRISEAGLLEVSHEKDAQDTKC